MEKIGTHILVNFPKNSQNIFFK